MLFRSIAGVSSFGFGGTNAHLVLQAPPPLPVNSVESSSDRPGHLFTLSARSETALRQLAERYGEVLRALPAKALGDLCYTANSGRTAFAYRLATWVRHPASLAESLAALATGTDGAGLAISHTSRSESPPLVWLFTGQGSQYTGMGRQLYETQPVFRATLEIGRAHV